MPRIRKIGRVYYSDIYIGGRRVRKPLATDRVVAEEKLADLIKDREAVRYGHARRDISWDEFKGKYLEFVHNGTRAEATAKRDVAAISSLEKFQKVRRLEEVTPELLERWKGARHGAGKGPATINRDLRAVKGMMKRARAWGYAPRWDGTSVKKLKETRGRLLFYTVEELRRLLAVCRSRYSVTYDWETICLLASRAGLRRAEIYWLNWRDVDLDRAMLSVTPKEGWQPKNAEQRHIPIPPDLVKHLRDLNRQRGWVLGDRPSLAVMSAFFRKISRKAKLKGNIHTLRHTYASHLIQAGVSLYVVSKLLGHKDVNMTAIYAHLAPSSFEGAVKALPPL